MPFDDHLHASDPHDLDLTEPKELPSIVRDVQAAGHCAECGKSLAQFTTIHVHQGKPYCPMCFNAEAGS